MSQSNNRRRLRLAAVLVAGGLMGSAHAADNGSIQVLEYARALTVDLTPQTAGTWTHDGAVDIWELDLNSAGAANLSLRFDALALPPGAIVTVFDPLADLTYGRYTNVDVSGGGQLWTAMVPRDSLRLRLLVPAAERDAVSLHIANLYHGFREPTAKAQSGACEVSVSCPTASGWDSAARSVAMITINGTRQCSATLLNNTRSDGDPLLLTARHCFVDSNGELPAESVVAYWSYALDSCGSGNLRARVSQSGATLLGHDTTTDATLLRLAKRPPTEANVYYSGWDAQLDLTVNGVTIHHPRGDDKKISTYTETPRTVRARIDNFDVQSLLVNWSEGVTEPGSSGSGLFNAAGLIIGQLSGGSSECGVSAGPDFYGRLDLAYGSAGTGFARYLDPSATGLRSFDGIDASSVGLQSPETVATDPTTSGTPTTGLTVFGVDVGSTLSDTTGLDNPADESDVNNTEPQRPEATGTDDSGSGGGSTADSGAGGLAPWLLGALGALIGRRRRAAARA